MRSTLMNVSPIITRHVQISLLDYPCTPSRHQPLLTPPSYRIPYSRNPLFLTPPS
ncbi:hypothetical protein EI94DRAFT_1727694 [Lactarius quietus]|nr:hypothetical protein EI94DRAFT_1727694 [Lactarius quietus]